MKLYRQEKKITKARLAERSGAALRTLTYWEANQHSPGLRELESLVAALGLTQAEHQTLISLLPVGKAGKIIRVKPEWTDIAAPPGAGDLIRALRWRKRVSREQAAAALGVHRSTFSRWETSLTAPDEEMRLRLCDLLGAFPEERAVLMISTTAPLRFGDAPTLDACREEGARLESLCFGQIDPLFDLDAHLLAGTLWRLAARQTQARSVLAQVYASHATYVCSRGDDAAALDYSGRSLALIRQGHAPPEAVWCQALWASNNALAHHAPQSGPAQSLRQAQQWLPKMQTPDAKNSLLISAAWWALEAGSFDTARNYWHTAAALVERRSDASPHLPIALRSVNANLLVKEKRYDAALEVGLQIADTGYQRQITRQLFQTSVFLEAGDKNSADSPLRRAYALIAEYQADYYRKEADGFADQIERAA